MNWKLLIAGIFVFIIAVIILALVFPSGRQATMIEGSEHQLRTSIPYAEINGVGLCTFDQKLISYSIKNGSMSCDFFNGTISSKEGDVWFTGRIIESYFSGKLSEGESTTYNFKGLVEGKMTLAYVDGRAYDAIITGENGGGIDLGVVLGIFVAIFGITALLISLYVRMYGIPSFLGGKKIKDTRFYDDKAKEYSLKNYDMRVVSDSGCVVNPNEKGSAIGVYKIESPSHMRNRLVEVVFKEDMVVKFVIDVPTNHIKEIHESEDYEQQMPQGDMFSRGYGYVPKQPYRKKRRKKRYTQTMPEEYEDFY